MAPRRPRRPRRRSPARAAVRPPPPAVTASPVRHALRLAEPPHSHIVCRSCGRIAAVDLSDGERQLLIALASRHPDGWTVDGIAFSLTGSCARCREGSPA
ncbi:MAG: hypothetical protein L3K10_04710 [Thermoplasmata archaeon]|nr:hypothetical protein [Thermoplasmata archaeon]